MGATKASLERWGCIMGNATVSLAITHSYCNVFCRRGLPVLLGKRKEPGCVVVFRKGSHSVYIQSQNRSRPCISTCIYRGEEGWCPTQNAWMSGCKDRQDEVRG